MSLNIHKKKIHVDSFIHGRIMEISKERRTIRKTVGECGVDVMMIVLRKNSFLTDRDPNDTNGFDNKSNSRLRSRYGFNCLIV